MIPAILRDILSAYIVDMDFGVISAKTSTIKVRIPVASPTHLLPKVLITIVAVRDEAEMFTMLLPIKIALNILLGSSTSLSTVFAFFTPSSDKALIRSLLVVVNAVSEAEKKADKSNNISNIIDFTRSLESN